MSIHLQRLYSGPDLGANDGPNYFIPDGWSDDCAQHIHPDKQPDGHPDVLATNRNTDCAAFFISAVYDAN